MIMEYFRNPVQLEQESLLHAMQRAVQYAGGLVLDIGCGSKPYEKFFSDRTQAYIGTDIDLSNAKKVDVCADSLQLPFRSSSFDTVVSNQAIEHVQHPEVFVAEASRVLKAGGTLIITSPQLWCLHEKPHDYYRFTRYALELLCAKNELDVLLLEERYGAFAAIGQMAALMVYLPNSGNKLRTHVARLAFGPAQLVGKLLDRLFYNPDLTLGYILVARKRGGGNATKESRSSR